jgi:hypothetical protein
MLFRISLPALRGSLGVVFGWFGILKLAAVPPVADLVTAVLDIAWIDPSWAVPALGRSAQLVVGRLDVAVGQPGLPGLADDLEAVVDDLIGDLGFAEFHRVGEELGDQ